MGYLEVGLVDGETVVEQDIDIYRTVVVERSTLTLCGVGSRLPQTAFYLLCMAE
jgi:hypothetical protein